MWNSGYRIGKEGVKEKKEYEKEETEKKWNREEKQTLHGQYMKTSIYHIYAKNTPPTNTHLKHTKPFYVIVYRSFIKLSERM